MAVYCFSNSLSCGSSYVGYRIWQTFQTAKDPCHGCAGCAIHDQLKAKRKLKGRKKPVCFK
ncbi:FeoB-associated Cys-rich membrane protein [Prevotella veroralis]|uniref:FeoB-associated Cys-rich membrane protein n=1 Tax=Prevotella veroralis TaxID=28137 RepID=UPI001EE2BF45